MKNLDHINHVVVLGQGVMGPDIALNFALAGYEVTGVDILEEPLDRAAKKTDLNCRQMIEEGLLSEAEAAQAKSLIKQTLEWDASVAGSDFIMEAVPEDMAVKQAVFARCDALCRPEVVVASNTSSMSISKIASLMTHPERAVTAHWTIPAHLSRMVEVICGEKTSSATKDLTFALLRKIGKTPVQCMDTPGFIHNYLQFSLISAALALVENKVASPQDVDSVVRNGFGLRLASVGPLQFLDMCGLDTVHNVFKYVHQATGDPRYQAPKILEEKLAKGDLGVKSGKGFYEYEMPGSDAFWERTNRGIMRVLKSFKDFDQ
jgi:3-hydroxybutyryl-CoA dehydrogenase